jgi:hypothetical protein
MYTFNLVDRQGYAHTVRAVGINSISDTGPVPDMTPIRALFPGFPAATFRRPQGEVDVLLGMNNRRLHPNGVKDVEDLRMMKSRIGPAYLITGSHPALTHRGSSILPEARDLSAAVLTPPPGACSSLSDQRSRTPAQDQYKEDQRREQVLADLSAPIQSWLSLARGGEPPMKRPPITRAATQPGQSLLFENEHGITFEYDKQDVSLEETAVVKPTGRQPSNRRKSTWDAIKGYRTTKTPTMTTHSTPGDDRPRSNGRGPGDNSEPGRGCKLQAQSRPPEDRCSDKSAPGSDQVPGNLSEPGPSWKS